MTTQEGLPMADELTLGEVARRMESGFSDIKDDIRDVAKRLDSKVNLERYQLERDAAIEAHRLLTERVTAIETARSKEAEQRVIDRQAAEERRRTDRRWILSAIVIPSLLVLVQVYITARGAGG